MPSRKHGWQPYQCGKLPNMGKLARRAVHTAAVSETGRVVQARRVDELENRLSMAVAELQLAEDNAREARREVYNLAGQLNGDGFTWRQLAALTGLSHVTLLQGFQRVVDEELQRSGLG